MTDVIVILLINLPLITIGRTINSDSSINFGTRIPKSELKSEEGIRRLKRIKIALILAGVITLAGGISCVIFEWEGLLFWIMLIPVTIAVIYMLLQLCMIQKNKKSYTVITLVFIGFVIILPLIDNTSKDWKWQRYYHQKWHFVYWRIIRKRNTDIKHNLYKRKCNSTFNRNEDKWHIIWGT